MLDKTKRLLVGMAAVAALSLGASAISSAASSTSSATSKFTPGSSRPGAPAFRGPAPGTAAHEDAEKTVTGSAATKAQAAAVKSVGSGDAGAVSTDYFGKGYEVTVTKTDGSKVEVHLDSSFQVMPGPRGPGGPPSAGGGQPPAGSGPPPGGNGA